jgi:hypothetical protein
VDSLCAPYLFQRDPPGAYSETQGGASSRMTEMRAPQEHGGPAREKVAQGPVGGDERLRGTAEKDKSRRVQEVDATDSHQEGCPRGANPSGAVVLPTAQVIHSIAGVDKESSRKRRVSSLSGSRRYQLFRLSLRLLQFLGHASWAIAEVSF